MGKLTKVKKKLEELSVKYEYTEKEANRLSVAVGEIVFWDKDNNRYSIDEHTGNGGKTVQGIVTGGKDFRDDYWTQNGIVRWLENNKDRF